MESLKNQNILSESEIIRIWSNATGDKKDYPDFKKGQYLSAKIYDDGFEAKLELYPDKLNNNHNLILRDFSAFPDDKKEYKKGIEMVSDAIKKIQESGLKFNILGPADYSDSDQIIKDIEMKLAKNKKDNIREYGPRAA